mmetsp:Transcript_12060/g.36084  ORF Transcript_12060/g.36084 Transcript_12060/m.36084 type:complete len:201 (-) Transcript_12060:24-626(-)
MASKHAQVALRGHGGRHARRPSRCSAAATSSGASSASSRRTLPRASTASTSQTGAPATSPSPRSSGCRIGSSVDHTRGGVREALESVGEPFVAGVHSRWLFHGTGDADALESIVDNPVGGFAPQDGPRQWRRQHVGLRFLLCARRLVPCPPTRATAATASTTTAARCSCSALSSAAYLASARSTCASCQRCTRLGASGGS